MKALYFFEKVCNPNMNLFNHKWPSLSPSKLLMSLLQQVILTIGLKTIQYFKGIALLVTKLIIKLMKSFLS